MTMPIWGAGQRVTGAKLMIMSNAINDINERLDAEDDGAADPTARTTTSVTYTTTLVAPNILGVEFIAPPSGIVRVFYNSGLYNTGANASLSTIQVATGAVIGSGVIFLAASDDRAIIQSTTGPMAKGRTARVSGLTPGATYNVAMYHRVTAGTGTFDRRDISVGPVLA